MDEPTANLDPVSRQQIFELILRLSKEKHMTIILVEHNVEEIIEYVNHLITFDLQGRVLFDVSGDQVEISYREWIESQQLKKISGEYERLEPSQECVLQFGRSFFLISGAGNSKKTYK